MVQRYVKNPVIIEAIQWTGKNLFKVTTFLNNDIEPDTQSCLMASDWWDSYCNIVKENGLKIHTLEGKMNADIGDYIIKGVKGEFYPCKQDIFELTYTLTK